MVENDYIPQTKTSHKWSSDSISNPAKPEVDMVKADVRDFIYRSECFKKHFQNDFYTTENG